MQAPLRTLSILLTFSALAHGQVQLFERSGSAAGDRYGSVVASVGDVDGDGAADWAVGAPFEDTAGSNAGLAVVISGRTGQPVYTWRGSAAGDRLGTSIAGAGDLDGDQRAEVVVGAPGAGLAYVHSGATGLVMHTLGTGSVDFGQAVAGGGQIDGDGVPDLLVGEPHENAGGTWRGRVHAFSGATGVSIRSHDGVSDWTTLGWSVTFLGDVDGDGRDEYAAGAPAAYVISEPSYVQAYDGASGTVLWTDTVTLLNHEYGFSLASIGDLSGDGARDLLAGAMQDPGIGCGGCQGKGYVRVLNGATGALLYQVTNTSGAYVGFGWSIAVVGDLNGNGYEDFATSRPGTEGCSGGSLPLEVRDGQGGALILSIPEPSATVSFGASLAFGDANGDGLSDLLCGAPCSDLGGTDSGAVYAFTVVRRPVAYCEAKVNSQGCTPTISGTGTPSASVPQPFRIRAHQVLNGKNGLLFYGFTPKASPFQGGTLCVRAPTRRTALQNSGGNPPPDDCSGLYSYDFNLRIRRGVDPALVAGAEVFCQYWSRDQASPSTTGLSDALAFFVNL